MITPSQVKGARAMLGLSQRELAGLAGVGLATVQRLELTAGVRGAAETLWKIQSALEESGVEFIPADGEKGPGVRLKHRTRDKRAKSAKARAR